MDDNNLSATILSKLQKLNKHDNNKNKQSVSSFYRGTTSLDYLLKKHDLRSCLFLTIDFCENIQEYFFCLESVFNHKNNDEKY